MRVTVRERARQFRIVIIACCIAFPQAIAWAKDNCRYEYQPAGTICTTIFTERAPNGICHGRIHFEVQAALYDSFTNRLYSKDSLIQADFPLSPDTAEILYSKFKALFMSVDTGTMDGIDAFQQRKLIDDGSICSIARICNEQRESRSWLALELRPDSLSEIIPLRAALADIASMNVVAWRKRQFLKTLPKGQFRTCAAVSFSNFSYRRPATPRKPLFRF